MQKENDAVEESMYSSYVRVESGNVKCPSVASVSMRLVSPFMSMPEMENKRWILLFNSYFTKALAVFGLVVPHKTYYCQKYLARLPISV